MKKRLLSFLFTGSLLLMLLPTAALAEDAAALSGGGIPLTNETISTYVNKDLGDGAYVLSENITVTSGSLRFNGTASLDLSGHTLTFTAPAETQIPFGSGGSSFVLHAGIVVSSGSMTLTDSSNHSGVLDVPVTESIGVLVTPGANFTMTGGTITNSTPDNNRGYGLAVFDATATMTGGKITGEKYCGVWTTDATTNNIPRSFTMSGSAVISDCGLGVDSSGYGGGVRIDAGTFTMEGGTIMNCAANKGGGVYVHNPICTFTMSGGSITNCKAGNGGGVYIESSTFNLSGGTISGCESNRGGGVHVHDPNCTFTMSSGSITDCSALVGGGVYMKSDPESTFTMEGGSITNCKATGEGAGYGGGVLMSKGRFTMNGGEISGCTANEGNSIYLDEAGSSSPTFTQSGGTIAGTASLVYQLNGTTCRMEGLGTSAYPYQIENGTQLLLFQSIVNGTYSPTQAANPAACAELTKDIDMHNITGFSPIGTETASYIGTFNGNNHNISGLTVNGSDAAGLFGYVDGATIQSINLCDSQITTTGDYAGGIVGFATDNAKIENCSTNNIKINADSSHHIGGIIGRGEGSTEISNCTNTSSFDGTSHVGGIAGSLNGGSITNCGNSGDLPAILSNGCVGGIVGFTRKGQISTCYNTGKVTGGSNADVGGIVGMFQSSLSISDCYNVGDVQGGLIGGIAGVAYGTFRYCYNTGAVTGSPYSGGVIGNNSTSTIEHCYYLNTAAPVGIFRNPQPGVESRTAAEFADGSVLTSLTEGRDEGTHPWNPECQYLNATGKTQPVFQQQGDTHNHTDGTWLHDGTNHWKVCTCNAVFDKAAHTAADDGNCTTPVLCEVCGVTVTAANADHTWGAWTSNSDGTHTRRCTTPGCTAGVETETCTDANHDYTCDLCGAALPRPAPTATPTAAPTATPTAAPTATPAPTATAAPGRRTESAAVTPTAAPTSTPPQPTPRPTATAQPVIPATGDTDTPVLWTVLLFLSGAALLTLTANTKRRKR